MAGLAFATLIAAAAAGVGVVSGGGGAGVDEGAGGADALRISPRHLEIAAKVAGQGLPACRSYHSDGSQGPCLPRFALSRGRAVNGWSRAGQITFSQGAAARLGEPEFALLAGHEIAHWYLGHQASSMAAELAADRLGAQLACQAGYDIAAGAALFRHLHPSRTHPPAAQRREAVLAAGCGAAGVG